jgi:hypothetical protein
MNIEACRCDRWFQFFNEDVEKHMCTLDMLGFENFIRLRFGIILRVPHAYLEWTGPAPPPSSALPGSSALKHGVQSAEQSSEDMALKNSPHATCHSSVYDT